MHPLNLTKIAFGCRGVEQLRKRIEGRSDDGEVGVTTRYRPTRADELIGGSLFWIVRHQLVARQRIIGFAEEEARWRIRLDADFVPVRPRARRAHQGWRYLTGEDAPTDFDGAADELAEMPLTLLNRLASLGLI